MATTTLPRIGKALVIGIKFPDRARAEAIRRKLVLASAKRSLERGRRVVNYEVLEELLADVG